MILQVKQHLIIHNKTWTKKQNKAKQKNAKKKTKQTNKNKQTNKQITDARLQLFVTGNAESTVHYVG